MGKLKTFKLLSAGMAFVSVSFLCINFFPSPAVALTTSLDVSISQTNYAAAPQMHEQDQQYSQVIPEFSFFQRWGPLEDANTIIKSSGLLVLPMSDSVDLGLAVNELYATRVAIPNHVSFNLGRKKENWSELDSYWNLGLWQPLVRWDAASPMEMGLTGFSVDLSDRYWRGLIFVSGVFLPDQQPGFEEVNGQITSKNRWFRAPVSRAELQAVQSEVHYEIQKPSASEVIKQNSYALMLEAGRADGGYFVKSSFSDKPMNQFHLAINPAFDLNSNVITAAIYPQVLRHTLFTNEFGYRGADWKFVLSDNYERFEKPDVPEGWDQTALIDAQYFGAIASHDLSFLNLKRSTVSMSYVERAEESNPQKSTIIKGDIEASTQRFLFTQMVGIAFKINLLRTYKRNLDTQFKYVYSIPDQGEWLQAGMQYSIDRDWTWGISGDIFGVPGNTSAGSSFISKYRGNDRLTGSLTYVF